MARFAGNTVTSRCLIRLHLRNSVLRGHGEMPGRRSLLLFFQFWMFAAGLDPQICLCDPEPTNQPSRNLCFALEIWRISGIGLLLTSKHMGQRLINPGLIGGSRWKFLAFYCGVRIDKATPAPFEIY